MNLPTQLTLGRICLVPLVVVFLISTDSIHALVAAILFAAAAVTDWLDGLIARRRGQVTTLGKRLYNDELKLVDEDEDGRRRYQIYGFEPSFEDEQGTDLAAVARARVSITPIHFDLTDREGLEGLRSWDIEAMLSASLAGEAPATR